MLVAHFHRWKHLVESVLEILVKFFDVVARHECARIQASVRKQRLLHMRFGGGVAIWCRECMLRYVEQRALRDVRRSSHRLCPTQAASFGEHESQLVADELQIVEQAFAVRTCTGFVVDQTHLLRTVRHVTAFQTVDSAGQAHGEMLAHACLRPSSD